MKSKLLLIALTAAITAIIVVLVLKMLDYDNPALVGGAVAGGVAGAIASSLKNKKADQ